MAKEKDLGGKDENKTQEYLGEWLDTNMLVNMFDRVVQATEQLSDTQDVEVAHAVLYVMQTVQDEDRWMMVGKGEDNISPQFKLLWKNRPNEDEARVEFRQATLNKFTRLGIKNEGDEKITVTMIPAVSAGIASVAYPVQAVEIIAASDKPLFVGMRLTHPLASELSYHPPVSQALRSPFAAITRRYVDDKAGFFNDRNWDGMLDDPTQLERYMLQYLQETYLRSRLDTVSFARFRRERTRVADAWNQARTRGGGNLDPVEHMKFTNEYHTTFRNALRNSRGVR